ncbi:tuftelin isoform X3 [Oryzias latipes]|uniref:tuftelin isoform X3 n=1 Tax=Oryzias latipes TaxID=8090 RepID=UPI0005CC889B|nr:tuftelin isoform X3 [Oryzias latipes]
MSGGVRRLSAENGGGDGTGTRTRTRGTQEPLLCPSEPPRHQQESSIAVVLPQSLQKQTLTPNVTRPAGGAADVIKVFLGSRLRRPESVRMLSDEESEVQEVRYCLKTLREQMAARQNNNNNNNKVPAGGLRVMPDGVPPVSADAAVSDAHVGDDEQESGKLKEVSGRLYGRLKEVEKQHQEETDRLQAESNQLRALLAERTERLRKAEQESKQKEQQVEELQRLLQSMAEESSHLKDRVAEKEAELLKLKANEEEEQRRAEEASVLKEKNRLLDDMLKSHQRKVRNMIEQVQNSKTMLQDRDRVIRDLEERVAFLDAENRELHDHMDFFLNGQQPPPPPPAENKPEVVYSKPLTPTTQTSKPLPFIKVVEIRS